MFTQMSICLTISIVLLSWQSVMGLSCYQCDSNEDLECSEYLDHDNTKLRPLPCEHIHDARFCIKTTGMYGGRIGTIRNCSARDLGDYCNYLERLGDIRYTRSCIYTCSSDGCNGSQTVSISQPIALAIALMVLIGKFLYFC